MLIIFCLTVLLASIFPIVSLADYNHSTWGVYESGGCTVKLFTDYRSYYSNADTVDVWATSDNCPTFYYDLVLVNEEFNRATSQTFSGYFSYRMPTKQFDIDLVQQPDSNGDWSDGDLYHVILRIYSDSAHNQQVAVLDNPINIYK
ncbi:hypothetical protein [Salinibacillus kushneri]|nr:hypothetical protein [Salinibacillus kushneri]